MLDGVAHAPAPQPAARQTDSRELQSAREASEREADLREADSRDDARDSRSETSAETGSHIDVEA